MAKLTPEQRQIKAAEKLAAKQAREAKKLLKEAEKRKKEFKKKQKICFMYYVCWSWTGQCRYN